MVLKAQHNRLTTPAVAGPVERGVSHRYLNFEVAESFKLLGAPDLSCETDLPGGLRLQCADAAGKTEYRFRGYAANQQISSVRLGSQDTAPSLTIARCSCAVPATIGCAAQHSRAKHQPTIDFRCRQPHFGKWQN